VIEAELSNVRARLAEAAPESPGLPHLRRS
jgi:hypothetical protein